MSFMQRELRSVIRGKIADGLAMEIPDFTRREIYVPDIRNKVFAVIGMRRSGKTTFLWQCLADRITRGMPREALLYFNFEDDRLAEMCAKDFHLVVEEYFSIQPQWRDKRAVTFMLDEIQVIKGWETFVRRLLDTEKIELFVSGSSARLLSREVASSMRGRAVEVLVHPFSFRETLRHCGAETDRAYNDMPKADRSVVEKHFRNYLVNGGFPEVQGLSARDRTSLLRTYVDVSVLRDVIERYGVTNPTAIRWLLRHLLSNPASAFSIQKFYNTLKSQGIAIAKNTLHDYLSYLQDAFLVRTVWMHSASERQRMVNPRKSYPVDPGLIPLYESTGRLNLGRALETVVLLELERRGCDVAYLRTEEGYEVDFYARNSEGHVMLIQVSAEMEDSDTFEREVRALVSAARQFPDAQALILTAETGPPPEALPAHITWQFTASRLLGDVP